MTKLTSDIVAPGIHSVTIHCSATPEGREFDAADIDRMHKARGWSGIGYHYVVLLNGEVERGRPENKKGAHVGGHNTGNIGVVYIGGVKTDGKTAKDTRTPEQKTALRQIVSELKEKYPGVAVKGHRDWGANKACPSFDVATAL